MAHWEHFVHQADIGVRGVGVCPAEAFEQTALALSAIVCDLADIHAQKAVDIACAAPDIELLLVDWLNAVIFEMATQAMLFSRYEVHLDGTALRATAWGEVVDVARHAPAVEPKGATYTELGVTQQAGGDWIAQCVVDV